MWVPQQQKLTKLTKSFWKWPLKHLSPLRGPPLAPRRALAGVYWCVSVIPALICVPVPTRELSNEFVLCILLFLTIDFYGLRERTRRGWLLEGNRQQVELSVSVGRLWHQHWPTETFSGPTAKTPLDLFAAFWSKICPSLCLFLFPEVSAFLPCLRVFPHPNLGSPWRLYE